MRDELLGYYERELIFLRRMGADFARKYPKVAARLLLDEEKIEDPHVERIVEAFAFLAGRISLKLEDELPEITEAFLNVLYPHYLAPIPSMAVSQFSYGSPKDKLTAVQILKRGSRLISRATGGQQCRFRTAYDVQLLPLVLESAALESPAPKDPQGKFAESYIRLRMSCYGGSSLSEITIGESGEPLESVRFFLNGDPQLTFPLYEIIFNHATAVEFRPRETPLETGGSLLSWQLKTADPVILPADAIRQVGFAENEALLPYTKRSFPGYRLLTEYFTFPHKFLFFDIHGVDRAIANKFGNAFDILIHLKDVTPPLAPVTKETFRMSCSPIINLFSRTADPIYLSNRKYEYQVIPDVHRQMTTEVYSVDDVVTTDPRTNKTREFSPFYSLKHAYGEEMEKTFWYAVRRASQRAEDDGTEVYLSMVDMNFNPRAPAADVITVRTTCTNRDLPAQLPFGGKSSDFEVEGTALLSHVRCLTKPTATVRPPNRRAVQWRLISHLNLNPLSLTEGENEKPEALQEILQLYNFTDSSATRQQILGITKIESRRVVRRIGGHIGAGFIRGLETALTFDEDQYVGGGMYLFACVLERFLALYTTLNSFSQLVVKSEQQEEIVNRFPPRAGEQVLL